MTVALAEELPKEKGKTAKEITAKRLSQILRTALGEVEQYLHDPSIIDIMLNPDRKLWINRLGKGQSDTGIIVSPDDANRFIGFVASAIGTECNTDNPIISTELPVYGSRFEALIPPVVELPTFAIRQPASKVFTLEDYVNDEIMTAKQKDRTIEAIRSRENILVVGGTGSGKTTLANAIIEKIAKTEDRVLLIQDTLELQCKASNMVSLRTQDHEDQTKAITAERLLKSAMRLFPKRIIVGEVRDRAAYALLKAWNTGHPGGLSTIHANSAIDGLYRLEGLIEEAGVAPSPRLISQAINVIIYIEQISIERKVQQVAEIRGFKDNEYVFQYI